MNTGKFAVVAVTQKGAEQAQFIAERLKYDLFLSEKILGYDAVTYSSLKECFEKLFKNYDGIIAVMAQGIVTRMIAPLLDSKYKDPAVVVCDEVGRYAISALSGHEGGANRLAHAVASVTGAVPVITTATEANKLFIAGIGCRKGTSKEQIMSALTAACGEIKIDVADIRLIASAWVKESEQGLIDAADELGIYLRFLPEHLFSHCPYDVEETAAAKHIGIRAVAEPCALMAGFNTQLILKKTIYENVTVAISKEMTRFLSE
ncbi:cobalamin biosynthesis protein [Seleniivibrio sp.]|uniref:cobalt-precorrin 5A hydrolase n=1 Tax=Seleniivibrio sp. TaxID=2898801 RepID=UPI0025E04201|nr:cobalamin biosynthesis protein [Seleniivibrio sp.]MCD8553825.1 cobalamin biosynthesis protein [Seleniivibrio sp.]